MTSGTLPPVVQAPTAQAAVWPRSALACNGSTPTHTSTCVAVAAVKTMARPRTLAATALLVDDGVVVVLGDCVGAVVLGDGEDEGDGAGVVDAGGGAGVVGDGVGVGVDVLGDGVGDGDGVGVADVFEGDGLGEGVAV